MGMTAFPHGLTSMGVPVIPGIESGVGLGVVFWVVTAKDSTNLWYTNLADRVEDDKVFISLQAAHDACTSGQSDTIFVTPGLYTTTAETEFTKSWINVVGTCGPNNLMSVAATITSRNQPGCTFYCDTAAVPYTLHITGHNNNFYNLSFVNSGAASTNLASVCIGKITTNTAQGNYFKRCTFHGCMDTAQNTIYSSSLEIGSGASNYMLEDCIIGQNTMGGAREVSYQGHLLYGGETNSGASHGFGPQNGVIKNTLFISRTATEVLVPAIRVGGGDGLVVGDEAMDRTHWFIGCHFDSWAGAGTTAQTAVFDDACSSYHCIRLVDCSAHRYAAWRIVRLGQPTSADWRYSSNMGIPVAIDSGIGIIPTT